MLTLTVASRAMTAGNWLQTSNGQEAGVRCHVSRMSSNDDKIQTLMSFKHFCSTNELAAFSK